MNQIADFWGLSFNESILLVAAILIVIDFFLPTDIPTLIAHVLICILIGINIRAHILLKILGGTLSWFALIAFHYYVWRATVQKFVSKFVAPDVIQSGADALVGKSGTLVKVEEKIMVRIQGDLWPYSEHRKFVDGTDVVVTGIEDGILVVEEKKEGKEP